MTALLALNGKRITSLMLTVPQYGAWIADVSLAEATAVDASVELIVGNLTLRGTVVRAADFGGTQTARLVAGGNGWGRVIPELGYSQSAGIQLSAVLADAARECGESIVVANDHTIGTTYLRLADPAERVLHLLAGGAWWVDNDGVTQTADRTTGRITTPFTVEHWYGGKGAFEIATEDLASWMPGRSFTAPTVTTEQTISMVTITADNDGKLRLSVLTTSGATDRMLHALRNIVRAETASLAYAGEWEYEIATATTTTVDARALAPGMPDVAGAKMIASLLGEEVLPTPGSKCRIHFINRDPTRPECVHIEGSPLTASIGGSATSIELGPLPLPLANAVPTLAGFAGIAAYIAAVTAAAASNPTSYTPFAAAIAAPGAAVAAILAGLTAVVPTTVVKGC